jgi:type IV secretory pathway TraG/TraD family ATPase VirD4
MAAPRNATNDSNERHAVVFGPNGSGKGVRFLMVNLLGDYLNGRSVVVIDPKGELAAVTAACCMRR